MSERDLRVIQNQKDLPLSLLNIGCQLREHSSIASTPSLQNLIVQCPNKEWSCIHDSASVIGKK